MENLKGYPPAPDQSDDSIDLSEFKTAMERAEAYLKDFKQESELTRSLILKDLPAIHELQRLGATDIPGLVEATISHKKGLVYDPLNPPRVPCPICESTRTGPIHSKVNQYRCYSCGDKFAYNFRSITTQTHLSLATWLKIVHCVLAGDSMRKALSKCDIKSKDTFLYARLRIFYAIHVYFERHPLRLYGNIQCDETEHEISYKGYNLKRTKLFPPTDHRYPKRFSPRKGKKRGGYSGTGNASKICIFAAATEKASYVCYCGIGKASVSTLQKYVPKEIFLPTVPETDDFPYSPDHKDIKSSFQPGDESLYLCDGSYAMKSFGKKYLCLKTHSRVYRKDGKQLRLSKAEKALHIQRANSVHSRLKRWLRNANAGSRYIKGHLLVFNFVTNTGGLKNKEAVDELIRILVEPNLLKPPEYLKEMFGLLPVYLLEWKDQSNVLSKLPEHHKMGVFLLDKIVHPENHPADEFVVPLTEEEVLSAVEMSREDLWAVYRDYCDAGLLEKVVYRYSGREEEDKKYTMAQQRRQKGIDSLNPTDYILYDRYAENRRLPAHERLSLWGVAQKINEEFGASYSQNRAQYIVHKIEKLGLREEKPAINTCNRTLFSYPVYDLGLALINDYLTLLRESEAKGETFQTVADLFDRIFPKYPKYTHSALLVHFSKALRYVTVMTPTWELPHIVLTNSDKEQLPSFHDILNVAARDSYEEYLDFCQSDDYTEKGDDKFIYALLDRYNIRRSAINTFRARMLHWAEKHDAPSRMDDKGTGMVYGQPVPAKAIEALQTYNRIAQEYLDKGMKKPKLSPVLSRVQEEVGLAPSTTKRYIAIARSYQRLISSEDETTVEEPIKMSPFRFTKGPRAYGAIVPADAFKAMTIYERIVANYKEEGIETPSHSHLLEEVQKELPLPIGTLKTHLTRVNCYRREGVDDISDLHLKLTEELLEDLFASYAEFRRSTCFNAEKEQAFFESLIAENQIDTEPRALKQYLLSVSNSCAHSRLPNYLKKGPVQSKQSMAAYKVWDDYQALIEKSVANGQEPPSISNAATEIASKTGSTYSTVLNYIYRVKKEKEREAMEKQLEQTTELFESDE